ncbi:MAG: hypothetical protein E7001_00500 [Coriobacteriaceae bacterium]|nr:hypothetical protein [Coriobacteriaceae bacterium]
MPTLEQFDAEIHDLEQQLEAASDARDFKRAEKISRALGRKRKGRARLEAAARKQAGKQARKKPPVLKIIKPRHTTADLLGYEVLFDDGVMRLNKTEYSCALAFEDVNYRGARDSEQELIRQWWGEYLNSLSSEMRLELSISSRQYSPADLIDGLDLADEIGEDYKNVLRGEYRLWAEAQATSSARCAHRSRVATITIKALSYEMAAPALAQEAAAFTGLMRRLGSRARVLSAQERLDAIAPITRPGEPTEASSLAHLEEALFTTSRDLVAPQRLERTGEGGYDTTVRIGERYMRCFTVTPDGWGSSMRDDFIADLLSLPCDITVSWHMAPWDQARAISAAEGSWMDVETENTAYIRQNTRPDRGIFVDRDTMPPRMQRTAEQADIVRAALEQGDESAFGVTLVIGIQAASVDELDRAQTALIKTFAAHRKPAPSTWAALREQMVTTLLPTGSVAVPYNRTMLTSPLTHLMAFASAEVTDAGGLLLGVNTTTRNFITYDPPAREHSNAIVLAQTRAGKSFNSKLTRVLPINLSRPHDAQIIIDPEGEYAAITEALGGVVIEISETSPHHINPLDITSVYGSDAALETRNPIPAKVSFIQSLVRMMAPSVTDEQASILDQAASLAYTRWSETKDAQDMPTLTTIWENLMSYEGASAPAAKRLAQLIERYVTGTLSIFNNKTNIDAASNLICFDLSRLSSELKPLALLIALDHVWVRVGAHRRSGKRTWLLVDEMQLLLDSDHAIGELDKFWARGGKWDLYTMAITQSIDRMLEYDRTRYMLQNSPFITMLHQAHDTARILQELLSLSDSQTQALIAADRGEGVYYIDGRVVPFSFILKPEQTPELYRLLTTTPDDIKRYRRAPEGIERSQGVAVVDEGAPASEADAPEKAAPSAPAPAPIDPQAEMRARARAARRGAIPAYEQETGEDFGTAFAGAAVIAPEPSPEPAILGWS